MFYSLAGAQLTSESVKMFDEGRALDLKCYFIFLPFIPRLFHLSLPETFNTLHINCTHGGDGPTFAVAEADNCARRSAVCFPRPEMIAADKRDL